MQFKPFSLLPRLYRLRSLLELNKKFFFKRKLFYFEPLTLVARKETIKLSQHEMIMHSSKRGKMSATLHGSFKQITKHRTVSTQIAKYPQKLLVVRIAIEHNANEKLFFGKRNKREKIKTRRNLKAKKIFNSLLFQCLSNIYLYTYIHV